MFAKEVICQMVTSTNHVNIVCIKTYTKSTAIVNEQNMKKKNTEQQNSSWTHKPSDEHTWVAWQRLTKHRHRLCKIMFMQISTTQFIPCQLFMFSYGTRQRNGNRNTFGLL